jgi:hypothetical protein
MRVQIARTRGQLAQAAETAQARTRREQTLLGLGAVGILAMALLVLVPPVRAVDAPPVPVDTIPPIPADPRPPSRRSVTPPEAASVSRSASATPPQSSTSASASARPESPASYGETSPKRPDGREGGPIAPAVAALCTDFARMSESSDINALLARAAAVLDATGIVIWMASADRDTLIPAASTGYDERLFSRIGSIPRGAANLTAAAFRDQTARTSARSGSAAPALAVPLVAPQGAVGVFSAELRDGGDVDPQRVAIASILAAQLSTLLGTMTTAGESVPAAQQQQAQG